ncbi:MAG: hypothetical protein R3B49_11135 [Phycisphaerales bacterium]
MPGHRAGVRAVSTCPRRLARSVTGPPSSASDPEKSSVNTSPGPARYPERSRQVSYRSAATVGWVSYPIEDHVTISPGFWLR